MMVSQWMDAVNVKIDRFLEMTRNHQTRSMKSAFN